MTGVKCVSYYRLKKVMEAHDSSDSLESPISTTAHLPVGLSPRINHQCLRCNALFLSEPADFLSGLADKPSDLNLILSSFLFLSLLSSSCSCVGWCLQLQPPPPVLFRNLLGVSLP